MPLVSAPGECLPRLGVCSRACSVLGCPTSCVPQALLHGQLPGHRAAAEPLPQPVCGLHGRAHLQLCLGRPGRTAADPARADHRGDRRALFPAPPGRRPGRPQAGQGQCVGSPREAEGSPLSSRQCQAPPRRGRPKEARDPATLSPRARISLCPPTGNGAQQGGPTGPDWDWLCHCQLG